MPLLGNFGGREGIYRFLQSPIPEGSPLSLVVGSCSLFATSTVCVHACRPEGLQWVQAHGLIFEGIVNYKSIIYWICCVNSLFWSTKRRVWKNNSLKLEKIPIMKNYGEGKTRLGVNNVIWRLSFGLQNFWKFVSPTLEIVWINNPGHTAHSVSVSGGTSRVSVRRQFPQQLERDGHQVGAGVV